MKIAMGSDHGGYHLKEKIKEMLIADGYEVTDEGTFSDESCDYPVFARKVCEKVGSGECEKGILVCGTGIGMSMTANKMPKIRAAVVGDLFSAKATRAHNDANVLCMGERVTSEELAKEITKIFLETPFEGGRHEKRIDLMMKTYEQYK